MPACVTTGAGVHAPLAGRVCTGIGAISTPVLTAGPAMNAPVPSGVSASFATRS